jgi:phage terminase large subunit-like protein
MYVSATANLAEKQLKAIKDILSSKIYNRYWPEMVNPEEGKREKWTTGEISVDHPKRADEGVRDPTVFACGVTGTQTGMHADVIVFDDLVVPENAYTEEGRRNVAGKYSQFASIANPGAKKWVVGTRYHPRDIYSDLMTMRRTQVNEDGEIIGKIPLYEKFERQVEDMGDGTGEFLWPRQQRKDGEWFGFNPAVLADIKEEYLDKTQFWAQYYNDPNDRESEAIGRDKFQYYDKSHIKMLDGYWSYQGKRLSVFAAIDFAYSLSKKADYTAVVVLGVDSDRNYFVLDIERFKTDRIAEYFKILSDLYKKWEFRTLRAEVTAAQSMIVRELKEHIRRNGLLIKIDEFRPNRHQGSKEERMRATLEPRYDSLAVYHYRGGNCQVLEEELVMQHPPHDDVKDALTAAMDIAVPPRAFRGRGDGPTTKIQFNSRFGGVHFGR